MEQKVAVCKPCCRESSVESTLKQHPHFKSLSPSVMASNMEHPKTCSVLTPCSLVGEVGGMSLTSL